LVYPRERFGVPAPRAVAEGLNITALIGITIGLVKIFFNIKN